MASGFSFAGGWKHFKAGLVLFVLVASSALAKQITVESRVQVSAPNGGWFPWYEVAADPTDSNNLIICGSKWDARDNAFSGFVYSTSDGGRTWHTALEDKNSIWVTEHSCAFGMHGKAYFVSEAAKVADGRVQGPDMGTTRIFVSNDSGRTWDEATRTTWADYSVSVVDTQGGANQDRLYTFFAYFAFNAPDPAKDKAEGNGSRIGVITFKDGENQVSEPTINPKMGSLKYHGSYPEKAFLLRDGSLLALYIAALKSEKGLDDIIGAERMGRDPLVLADPVVVARAAIDKSGCYPSHFAAAYDRLRDRVYVAYPESRDGQCRFLLKTSADGGRTWSNGREIPQPGTKSQSFFSSAMALNESGILGLIWRDEPVADCWYFAASLDEGKTFTPAQSLSKCSDRETLPLSRSGMSLTTTGSVLVPSDPSKPGSPPGHPVLGLQVVDHRNYVWRNTGSLTASTDGVFHPVWIEAGHGEGQLRTATVTVGASRRAETHFMPQQEKESHDISQDVAVLYGGDQHYDATSGTLTVDVVLKNRSNKLIRGPLLLKALTLSSGLGKLEIANARNAASGPGAIWDFGKALPSGVLQPGATSLPYSLVFRLPSDVDPSREIEVVSMQLEALAPVTHPGRPR
jgi:hypothetical protein